MSCSTRFARSRANGSTGLIYGDAITLRGRGTFRVTTQYNISIRGVVELGYFGAPFSIPLKTEIVVG